MEFIDSELAMNLPPCIGTFRSKERGYCAVGRVMKAIWGEEATRMGFHDNKFAQQIAKDLGWDGYHCRSRLHASSSNYMGIVDLNNSGQTELATKLLIDKLVATGKYQTLPSNVKLHEELAAATAKTEPVAV